MNKVSKLIVPLLDDTLTREDLLPDSGFVDAYTEDINRPYLEDMVFLMYKSKAPKALLRFIKFKKLDTIHSTRYITINKEHYTVYAFNKVKNKKDINNLISGKDISSTNNKLRIYNFWQKSEIESLIDRIFGIHYRFSDSIREILPEEDYYPYEE